jgi:3-hydroxyisobutyrate dehydrogenase
MGRGMALTLRRGGFDVTGYDVSEAIRTAVGGEGVAVVGSIGAVCVAADVVILSLPNAAIVEEVVAGTGGIAETAGRGLAVVDTSTSHPATTRKLWALLADRGVALVDAPVSGGPAGAHAGTMTMVVGGADGDVARVMPVLEAMSARRVHVGPVGSGHVLKIVNNLLCAAHLLTAAEALRISREAGIDDSRLLDGLNAGSGRSGVTMVNLPNWVVNGAFNSGFTMKLMRKDVRLAAQVLGELGLDLPMASRTAEIWNASTADIGDDEDFNRIVELQLGRQG